jgi:hypothetical protein
MYSISNVIVGVPISEELDALLRKWEDEDDPRWREWEDLGFEVFYHGGASCTMGYCGVQISEWNECGSIQVNPDGTWTFDDYEGKKTIVFVPTDAQVAEAKKKVDALDPELRKLCPEFGVHIVQSTS